MWQVLLLLLLFDGGYGASPTMTLTPSQSNSISMSETGTPSGTLSSTLSGTLSDTATGSLTRSITESFTHSATITISMSNSITLSNTDSISSSISSSLSLRTATSTSTITASFTNSASASLSNSLTDSVTLTSSISKTATYSLTQTESLSKSYTLTPTETISKSESFSLTPSFTESLTETGSLTITDSISISDSLSVSESFSLSLTLSQSITESVSVTLRTGTATFSRTSTHSLSASLSLSESLSLTVSESLTLVPTPTRPLPYFPPLTPAELVVNSGNITVDVSNVVLSELNSAYCQQWPSGKCGCVPKPCHGPDYGPNPGWINELAKKLDVSANRIRADQVYGGESLTGRYLTDRFSELTFDSIASLENIVPFTGTLHLAGIAASSFTDQQLLEVAAAYKKDLLFTYFVNTTDSPAVTVMADTDPNGLYIRHSLQTSLLRYPSDSVSRYHLQYNENNVWTSFLEESLLKVHGGDLILTHIIDSDMRSYGVDKSVFNIRGYTSAVVTKIGDLNRLRVAFQTAIASLINETFSVVTIHALELSTGAIIYSIDVTRTSLTESEIVAEMYTNALQNGGLDISGVQAVWDTIVRITVDYNRPPTITEPVPSPPYISACWGASCTTSVLRREMSSVGEIVFGNNNGGLDSTVISEALSDSIGMPSSQIIVQYDPVSLKASWMLDTNGFNKEGLAVRLSQLPTSFGLAIADPSYTVMPAVELNPYVRGMGSNVTAIKSEIVEKMHLSDCQNPDSIVFISPILGSNAMKVSFANCIRVERSISRFDITTTEDVTNTLTDAQLLAKIIERASCCEDGCPTSEFCIGLGVSQLSSSKESYCGLLSEFGDVCNRTTGCSWNESSISCAAVIIPSTPAPVVDDDDEFPVGVVAGSIGGFILLIILICVFMKRRMQNEDYDYPPAGHTPSEGDQPNIEQPNEFDQQRYFQPSPTSPAVATTDGMANPLSLPIQFEGDLSYIPSSKPISSGVFNVPTLPEGSISPVYPSPPISRHVGISYPNDRLSPLPPDSRSNTGAGRGSISPPPLPPVQTSPAPFSSQSDPPTQTVSGVRYTPPPVYTTNELRYSGLAESRFVAGELPPLEHRNTDFRFSP